MLVENGIPTPGQPVPDIPMHDAVIIEELDKMLIDYVEGNNEDEDFNSYDKSDIVDEEAERPGGIG